MSDLFFFLNGEKITLACPPSKLLINVLREQLGLTGTKLGCGSGTCGCCTVLVDGKPVQACTTRVSTLRGAKIATIEGLSPPNKLHALQKAFAELGAVQCGFCTPGMIMRAKGLLDLNPRPSRAEIIAWMEPNLCRCTGYQKIIEAIARAADLLLGRELYDTGEVHAIRTDLIPKVKGQATYTDDITVTANALVAKLVRSPHHHATITSIDISQALNVPGVLKVFLARDIPGENKLGRMVADQPVLAETKVRWLGEPVALVVAESEASAAEGAGKVMVEYEELPAVLGSTEALERSDILVHEGRASNLLLKQSIIRGDVEGVWETADFVIENTYFSPWQEHGYLEPEAGIAYFEDDKLVISSGIQSPYATRVVLARMLGCLPAEIRLKRNCCGGSFGGKAEASVEPYIALAANYFRRPVKMRFSQVEVMTCTHKKHPFLMQFKTAVVGSKIVAMKADLLADTGAYALSGPAVLKRAAIQAYGPYNIPNVQINAYLVYTNNIPSGALRGFGVPQVTFAVESQIDAAATKLSIHPIDFRLKNILREGDSTATGQTMLSVSGLAETLQKAKVIYDQEVSTIVEKNKKASGIKYGVGMACMWFGIGRTCLKDFARIYVDLNLDGSVTVYSGLSDIGQGSDALLSQVAAEVLNMDVALINVISGDTDLAPECTDTNSSKVSYMSVNALLNALQEMKQIVFTQAAADLGVAVTELEFASGLIRQCNQEGGIPLRAVARQLAREAKSCRFSGYYETQVTDIDPVCGQGIPHQSYEYAAQIAAVAVKEDGNFNVEQIWSIHDVGKVLNRINLEGQIEGGIVMGLGQTTKEVYLPGKTRLLKHYSLPTFSDAPRMEHEFVEGGDPYGPMGGAKGAGEGSSVTVAAAVANALHHALGIRCRELPLCPQSLS